MWQVAWPWASHDVKSGALAAAEPQGLQHFSLLMQLGQ